MENEQKQVNPSALFPLPKTKKGHATGDINFQPERMACYLSDDVKGITFLLSVSHNSSPSEQHYRLPFPHIH